jgi:hypothetical protein
MRWVKRGLIFHVEKQADWMWTHAGLPVALRVDEEVLRIFFGTRDTEGRSLPAFIDVRADDPRRVLYVHDRPLLERGALGAFDDSGVTPSCIAFDDGGRLLLFYIGWSRRASVPYHLAIGLAASDDGGRSFARVSEGPIMERTASEPFFVTSPCVLREAHRWRMWYCSSGGWLVVRGQPEPVYEIKYAESDDGVIWQRPNITCIGSREPGEAIARPSVIRGAEGYRMWYAFRGSDGYRTDRDAAYRIGYAESSDGVRWERKDSEGGLDRSESGWDSVMTAYPFVYEHAGTTCMLYNGDGFGRSGFGYAVMEDE